MTLEELGGAVASYFNGQSAFIEILMGLAIVILFNAVTILPILLIKRLFVKIRQMPIAYKQLVKKQLKEILVVIIVLLAHVAVIYLPRHLPELPDASLPPEQKSSSNLEKVLTSMFSSQVDQPTSPFSSVTANHSSDGSTVVAYVAVIALINVMILFLVQLATWAIKKARNAIIRSEQQQIVIGFILLTIQLCVLLFIARKRSESKTNFNVQEWIGTALAVYAILFVLLAVGLFILNLQDRNRMKLQLKRFDHVTHDLRSPMQVVVARSEKISAKAPPNLREEAERLSDDVKDMARRLEDLLQFNRLEAHRQKLDKQTFRLGGVAIDLADQYIFLAEEKGIQIITDDIPMDVQVFADENMIRSAIQNYLTNAIKHTSENGTIRLSLRVEKRKVRFTVENTGKILTKKEQKIIWKPYQQANATRDNAQSGIGLGLTFVKMFIELHNGRYGCGATDDGMAFWFELPIVIQLKRFVNTSGRKLTLYADSNLKKKIASIPHGTASLCGEETDEHVAVSYRATKTGTLLVGYTDYVQGIQSHGARAEGGEAEGAGRAFFCNTSGRKLPIYKDKDLRRKVAKLNPRATCLCEKTADGPILVIYEIRADGTRKVGYTDYVQGIQPEDSSAKGGDDSSSRT